MSKDRDPDRMKTANGLERYKFFTDAVVAIAITLLVLPLVELSGEMGSGEGTAWDLIRDHEALFWTFVLSFIVIARLWMSHHALFERVGSYNVAMLWTGVGWMMTIAFLPFTTEVIAAYDTDRATIVLYIGDIALNTLFLTLIAVVITRTPTLQARGSQWGADDILRSAVVFGCVVVALFISLAVPAIGYFSLLTLSLSPAIARLLIRRVA